MNTNSAVILVVDDVAENRDPAGQLFGDCRIAHVLAAADPGNPGILDALIGGMRGFEAGRPASDDMAAILLSVT